MTSLLGFFISILLTGGSAILYAAKHNSCTEKGHFCTIISLAGLGAFPMFALLFALPGDNPFAINKIGSTIMQSRTETTITAKHYTYKQPYNDFDFTLDTSQNK